MHPLAIGKRYDNEEGTIDFSAGKISGTPPSGTFTVATIQFRALGETVVTSLTFAQTETRNTEAAHDGESILGSLTGATVTIEE